jgi:threonine synthase
MQLVHYVWTYLRVIQAEAATKGTSSACDYSQSITFVIPTGAMGNIAGGYMAKQMGLPIRKLVVAVNANDASHRVIQTGQLQKKPLIRTLSEAMNIQIPYNLERLLFYRTSQNHELISQWMKEVDSRASLDLTSWLEKLREDFDSAAASDSQVCEAIATVLSRFQYYMDPHTAVGWSAADQLGYTASPLGSQAPSTGGSSPVVLLATASPCKFENAYSTALGPEGWKAYVASSEYPVAARRISECTEVPPIMYSAEPTLEASQTAWERQAREIVRKLEQAAT